MTNEMMIGISAFVMGMCSFIFAIVSHKRMNKRIDTLDRLTGEELAFMSERVSDFRFHLSSIDDELDGLQKKTAVKKKAKKK